MCLIVFARDARPEPEHLENGASSNSHGTGIAWKENGYLRYEKGLDTKEVIKMSKALPLGFVIHFRIASAGGTDEKLIHPFPVRLDVPLKQKGKSNKLLFHNGHWSPWKEMLVNHLSPKIVLPDGVWSDTRAIALLTAIHGPAFLKVLTEGKIGYGAGKFVLMTPAKTKIYGDWKEEKGVFYSNGSYDWGSYRRSTGGYWDRENHVWVETEDGVPTGTTRRNFYMCGGD
jgi:hypothetical protein